MKVRVTVVDARVVTIHCEPSLLERFLFGRTELDDMAVAVPSIRGGNLWVRDSTGRRIRDRRVIDAIERALQRAASGSQTTTTQGAPR